ncbi:uncharacterized protein LOC115389532 isoform X1 [Salarias fasciatus]|uniref:uncharacterized protein LOC115389532 isoform X1 n=2 Tax=Salarias fasciatus TaxID=181472 RepID=UPI0011769E12|nr:uncharacterized protein LOC115389532 isoform X1 [Salarias fasciatus]XP_029948793.1 uncharacterized protein LOC115389532 isoform X1 [Salarias fasciatus]
MRNFYRNSAVIQQKKKQYIRDQYRNNPVFQQKQKQYIRDQYRSDPVFQQKQRQYITSQYKDSEVFRQRQKSYMIHYFQDQTFRRKHRLLMRKIMQERYQNDEVFRETHRMRCALKIRCKYRQIHRQPQQQDNSLVGQAISIFRAQIKAGPTSVCTVCHKASFPNQVKVCTRTKYLKNPNLVAACLTGKFVHHCNESCRSEEQCKVPDERKKEWICHTCHDHLRRGAMPSLAVHNNLELVDIPSELSDLNILERHLISKCIPFAKIIPLPKGRQSAIRGNVVCVPSEIQETVEALPRLRSESQIMRVKLKRRLCYRGHQLFQTVTWSKLMQALHKLKQIHPQYSEITIREEAELCDPTLPDEEDDDDEMEEFDEADLMEIDRFEKDALCENEAEDGLDVLSCDGEEPENRPEEQQEGDMPNGGFALESCLQPPNVAEEIMSFSDGIYSVAPAERNSPVGFFKTPKLEAMAFPVQFPTGQNTLDESRRVKLSPSSYFKSRLFSIDDRFARDSNYLFFAQFVIEVHLATNSMTIQLRKGKPMTRDGRKITSGMLQDRREVEKLVRNREAFRFMRALRGTPAYWHQKTSELFAMIRQLGTPTFFCTFSAAEMRWPEVIEAIKRQQGEEVNFEELDWSEKCDILRSNPVTAMRMFDKRVEALFRDLLLSPAQPLGKVVDFFYRVEFQHRGSPHIHCLLWVEGAPVFEKDDDQTVCDFVSRYITAQLPDPHTQPDLYKKVSEVQKHSRTHTKTCFKSVGSGCRFGFPKPPCRNVMITRPDGGKYTATAKTKLRPLNRLLNEPEAASMSLDQLLAQCDLTVAEYEFYLNELNKSSAVLLKRDPKDCWINAYNPHLLTAWDANIDVSYILNAYGCIHYLTKYITKKEAGLSEYLKTVINNSNTSNVNDSEEMKAVMQAYSKKREISAQECVARACGLKMKKCSRAVVFIPTDENPLRMSRPLSFLENTTDECTNIWMTSLADKYKNRPETPEFEEMCMADFAATCRFVRESKGADVFPLLNDMGFVQRRKNDKPAVIRYYRCSEERDSENFHGRLLKLYLPHRSDEELKRPGFPTYQSFYRAGWVQLPGWNHGRSVEVIVKQNREKYEKNSEEIEKAVEEFQENQGVMDEWCNLAPQSEVVRLDYNDDAEQPDPDDPEQENVPEYSRQADAVSEARVTREPPVIDPAVLRHMYQSLNLKQASFFYTVREWCIRRVCGLRPEQFFYYINGGAGTGKSHLIKCIHSEASKILRNVPRHCDEVDISKPTVLLTAFTGTAAFNISGSTLHSLLKLPRSLKPPIQGLGNKLDEVRAELLNAEILIIDEVSMVSRPLFVYVDARLKQIKGSQRPFGGVSVIAVGDFYQLPPVRHSTPLCVFDPSEIDLWHEHFQMITLTEIMRQKDDVAFAEMLNRIRVKDKSAELSEADRALIYQTVTEPALCPTDVLHIYATNKQVDAHNSARLAELFDNIITIDADDFEKDPQTGRMTRKQTPVKGGRNELPDSLQVAEGVRVMLTRNIDVQSGLVNGSFGTLVRCISENDHVTKLGLRMDSHVSSEQNDDVVYIQREEDNLKQKGVVRRQFPIKLAFACTIHKVQGMSMQSAVVSLKNIFEPGMAYVAVSRVTSLGGLYIVDMDESKFYASQRITAALESMRQASPAEMMPRLQMRETLSRPDTLTIIHHNTEGLPAHISDIKSHHEMCLADILCLTETHLQGSFVADSLQLPGYNLFRRNRHLSYSNFPQIASRGGGGVAIYVRNHIQAREKQYLLNVTDLEFVALKLDAPVSAIIAAVYRPPNYDVTSFLANLSSFLDSLEILDCQPIIVCGDFNENLSSTAKKPILELFQTRGYAQLITASTTEKNTLLDLIFISQPDHCVQSGVLRTYHSYHNPVYCVLNFSKV